jgi:ATP-dependent helicase YprA (DUF1998 family)
VPSVSRCIVFLPVPVDGAEAKGHGAAAKRYQIQIDGCEVSGHEEIVSVRAKNKAPARWPAARRRHCPGRRNSRGAVNSINNRKISLIDFKG